MLQTLEKKRVEEFSVREAREIVRDLFEPNPRIYWADLLISAAIGTLCLRLLRRQPLFSPLQVLGYFGALMAFYRAGSFTHELCHLRRGTFKWFRAAWNVMVGIPFFMPSFMYHTHVAHHARNHYATSEDGEYLPLASGPPRNILLYMSQPLVLPIVYFLRFVVLAPLGWVVPGFGRWVQQRASSLVMDPRFVRPLPSNKELQVWRVQEVCCFLLGTTLLWLFGTGRLEWTLLVKFYLLAVGTTTMNQLRTLGAHRFLHGGRELSFLEQLLDSVNYPEHRLLTSLWAPVGLRYHALHHLFPSMPYHALDEAHRRLLAELPADSPYRRTSSSGLWRSIGELWRRARRSSAG